MSKELSPTMRRALNVCRDEGALVGFRGGYWHGIKEVERHNGKRPPWGSTSFGTRTVQALLDRGLIEPGTGAFKLRSGMATPMVPVSG